MATGSMAYNLFIIAEDRATLAQHQQSCQTPEIADS
jgi:hypothetical protein